MLSDAVNPQEKCYPRFTVDLTQFDDIYGEVDDNVTFTIQGRICARTHTDYCRTVEVEVRKISGKDDSQEAPKVAVINIADQELSKLKRRSL